MPKSFEQQWKSHQKDAEALLEWLETNYELEPAEPLVKQMLQITTRLSQVRSEIEKGGILIDGKPNPLLATEHRLVETFTKIWKVLGLADMQAEERRAPGRPPNSERGR